MLPRKSLFATTLLIALGVAVIVPQATAGWGGIRCFDQTGCDICCPECDHVCHLKVERVDADESCFDVESKVICIPRVVFPWQKKKSSGCSDCDGAGCHRCGHNGAKTRTVCVLVVKQYTCPECAYSWSAKRHASDCDLPGCDFAITPHQPGSATQYRENQSPIAPATASPANAQQESAQQEPAQQRDSPVQQDSPAQRWLLPPPAAAVPPTPPQPPAAPQTQTIPLPEKTDNGILPAPRARRLPAPKP